MLRHHDLDIRVRYHDTDAQGRVHHASYVNYFETGRVEMLRTTGRSYKDIETSGIMLVVVHLAIDYHYPAEYDDLLTLRTTVVRAHGVRIEHRYELFRDDQPIVSGRTIVAAVGRDGKIKRLPDYLRLPKS